MKLNLVRLMQMFLVGIIFLTTENAAHAQLVEQKPSWWSYIERATREDSLLNWTQEEVSFSDLLGRQNSPLNITVIPIEAFEWALQDPAGVDRFGNRFYEVDDRIVEQVVQLNGLSNDPVVHGVYANLKRRRKDDYTFSGDNFIVAMDAKLSPDGSRVEFTQYFHAAVSLKGHSSWTGENPNLATTGERFPGAHACCKPKNSDNFNISCGSIIKGIEPNPMFCGSDIFCGKSLDDFTQPHIDFDFSYGPPLEYQRILSRPPFTKDTWGTTVKRSSGQYVKPIHILTTGPPVTDNDRIRPLGGYGDYDPSSVIDQPGNPYPPFNPEPGDPPVVDDGAWHKLFAMKPVFSRTTCDICNAASFDPDQCLPFIPLDPPYLPNNPCSNAPNDVPLVCQQMNPAANAALCGGFSHQRHDFTANNYCNGPAGGGVRDPWIPHTPGVALSGTSPSCTERNPHPTWCDKVDSVENSECYTSASTREFVNQFWLNEVLGCRNGTALSNVECIEGGACMDMGGGVRFCIDCNDAGSCREYTKKGGLGDPLVMDEAEEEEEEVKSKDYYFEPLVLLFEKPLQEEITFPPQVVERDVATTSELLSEDEPSLPRAYRAPSSSLLEDFYNDKPDSLFDVVIAHGSDATKMARAQNNTLNINPNAHNYKTEHKKEQPQRLSDPVLIGDGSLEIVHLDISIPGPVKPLEFKRIYNSRSTHRGSLGSSWTHNYEARINAIQPATAPAWISPYCVQTGVQPNCLLYEDGQGNTQIFYRDLGSKSEQIYMPQAGSTDTIIAAQNGWILRSADGHRRTFNNYGYMIKDQDRFGNGFKIEYEHTPLHLLYVRYCGVDADPIFTKQKNYDPRLCDILAYNFGDGILPDISENGLPATRGSGNSGDLLAYLEIQIPSDPLIFYNSSGQLMNPGQKKIAQARTFLTEWLKVNIIPENPTGNLRMRPLKVVDNLEQTLVFNYHISAIKTFNLNEYNFSNGLLESISGPEGIRVVFEYNRPFDDYYSPRLADMFLTKVSRDDRESSDPAITSSLKRTYEYEYLWHDTNSQRKTYSDYISQIEKKYLDLFSAYNGCDHYINDICDSSNYAYLTQGNNPCLMATVARDHYAASIADNIIRVKRSEIIEVESEYVVNPGLSDFEKVITQRYGGLYTNAVSESDDWKSGYPEFKLEYIHPSESGIIPPAFTTKYPLELPPSDACKSKDENSASCTQTPTAQSPRGDLTCNKDTFKYNHGTCYVDLINKLEASLPGNNHLYEYYEKPEPQSPEQLVTQTHLTCSQLAAAQIADPLHTGLVAKIRESVLNPNYLVADYDQKGRQRIAKDVLRICQWVKSIDRDKDIRYYGLNFRGQTLVEVAAGSLYSPPEPPIFSERHFNTDGKLIWEKDPHHGSQSTGFTEYLYDEIDPNGNSGHNAFIPGYWTRRNNLLEQKRTYVTAVENHNTSIHNSDVNLSSSLGHYTRYTYEPLFNQLRTVESGEFDVDNQENWHERIHYDFDYQELEWGTDSSESSIAAHLISMVPYGWGFSYSEGSNSSWILSDQLLDNDGEPVAGTTNYLRNWQFPIHFYNTDLNGDGTQGFPFGKDGSRWQVMGVPVRMTHTTNSQPLEEDRRTYFGWARHGKLSDIYSDNGKLTHFEYYASGSRNTAEKFGTNTPPQSLSSANNGHLARITTNLYDTAYPALHQAPLASELANDICTQLPGPYRYILPGGCTNPEADLFALGVPQNIASNLLNSPTHTIQEFSYNRTGYLKHHWQDNNHKNSFETDLDGRIVKHTDSQNVITEIIYSKDGWPTSETTRTHTGSILAQTLRAYDTSGNILVECNALTENACTPVFANIPSINTDISTLPPLGFVSESEDPLSEPEYQLSIYHYTPEGQLSHKSNPAGIVTSYSYDANKRLKGEYSWSYADLDTTRMSLYQYDVLGKLISVNYGLSSQQLSDNFLNETYTYDSAERLIKHTDTRSSSWSLNYDNRDQLTQISLIGNTIQGRETPQNWKHSYAYNGFGELVQENEHDLFLTTYSRTNDGRLYRIDRTGTGPIFVTFDTQGNPLWVRDAAKNAQVYSSNNKTNQKFNISLLKDERNSQHYALSTSVQLNASQYPISMNIYNNAGALSYTESWERNGLGYTNKHTNPDGLLTKYTHNLAGWVLSECQSEISPDDVCSQYSYNSIGQVVAITDPKGQITTNSYTGFGQLYQTIRPGSSSAAITWTYDGHGRPTSKQDADNRKLTFEYFAGDLIKTTAILPDGTPFKERTEYRDALGRVTYASQGNEQLQSILNAYQSHLSHIKVQNNYVYDNLNRIIEERVKLGTATEQITDYEYTDNDNNYDRTVLLPTNAVVYEKYDSIGRLSSHSWQTDLLDYPNTTTEFDWDGYNYAGRQQIISPEASPFRESAKFDKLRRRIDWNYTALDLKSNGTPKNPLQAGRYCNYNGDGTGWEPAYCDQPLLNIRLTRQATGRISEVFTQPGFPNGTVRDPDNFTFNAFSYSPIGRLTGVEYARQNIDKLQTWLREPAIGSLNLIEETTNNATESVWEATRDQNKHRLDSVDNFTNNTSVFDIEHDEFGNIIQFSSQIASDIHDLTYEFDSFGQLIAIENISTSELLESYIYDHQGRLVGMIDAADSLTIFNYDGENIVAATKDGTLQWEAAWGPGTNQIIAFHDHIHQKSHIPLTDYRNSIVATWNVTDQEVSQFAEYDPNGVITLYNKQETEICSGNHCPNVNNLPFGFTSALRSPVTGLIHMRARWYSPQLGQFISPDPLGYIDSYNLYSYALFDPINNWDPYGLSGGGYAANGQFKSSMTPGPATWARDAGKLVERGFDYIGQASGAAVINAEQYYTEKYLYSDSKIVRYAAVAGLVFTDVGSNFVPHDGQDAMFAAATLPAGLAFRGSRAVGQAVKSAGKARKASNVPFVKSAIRQCSFTEDTPVLMCDGSLKPIQHVRAGEFVLSRSEETGEFGCREVVEPYSNPDKAIIRIELLASDGSLEVIEATANHPFYVEGQGWTRVDELDTNDLVPGSTGELLRIVALESTDRIETVFNFGVEEFHSYFVGELGAWVHNCIFQNLNRVPKTTSRPNWGHTFSEHGQKKTRNLIDRARDLGPQGQWLNDEKAAEWLFNNRAAVGNQVTELPLPQGLGQIILRDGSIMPASHARIVLKPDGSIKSAFPIIME